MANLQDIDIYIGENVTQTLYARDSSNAPVDLTSKTVSWSFSRPPNFPWQTIAVNTVTGTVVSASAGSFTVAITPGITNGLVPGNYCHQAQTTDASGNVSIVTVGNLRLRSYITAAA